MTEQRPHLIDGEFQSDKYPTCPRGKVPLSCKDVAAQDLLWEYARRCRSIDADFSDDLEQALLNAGYQPNSLAPNEKIEFSTETNPPPPATPIDIVFDGPPGPDGPRFIEIENSEGRSISLGEWIQRPDGYWVIRFSAADLPNVK